MIYLEKNAYIRAGEEVEKRKKRGNVHCTTKGKNIILKIRRREKYKFIG